MTNETSFVGLMRAIATDPAARSLLDDAAVLDIGDQSLVLTHDMMAEGVHWLPSADPADIAWKLVASNLSDLAAKGARPQGVLLGFMLGEDDWDRRFAVGLEEALTRFDVALLGGDTVSNRGDKRALGVTAIGVASHRPVPSRSGAIAGDWLYVTGTIGDALAGFELAEAGLSIANELTRAYNRPEPRLLEGRALAPSVSAMMDISDGLLIDADRLAKASGVGIVIDLSLIPLSAGYIRQRGETVESRLQAASWGDDYQLLFTAPAGHIPPVAATKLGEAIMGPGLSVHDAGQPTALPPSLGYQHH